MDSVCDDEFSSCHVFKLSYRSPGRVKQRSHLMLVISSCWREMPGTSLLAIISIGKLHVLLDQPFLDHHSAYKSRRNYFAHTHTHYYTLETLHTVWTETFMVLNFRSF